MVMENKDVRPKVTSKLTPSQDKVESQAAAPKFLQGLIPDGADLQRTFYIVAEILSLTFRPPKKKMIH